MIGSCGPGGGLDVCFEYRPVDGEVEPSEQSLIEGPACQTLSWRDAPCDVRTALGGCSVTWSQASTGAVFEEVIWFYPNETYPSQAAVIERCERDGGTFIDPV